MVSNPHSHDLPLADFPSVVMEDYLRMMQQMLEYAPDILFPSSAFLVAFRVATAGLTLVQSDIVFAALDFLRDILTHDCLDPPPVPPPKFPIYANAIKVVVEKTGLELTRLLLAGLVGDFPGDATSSIITIFRTLGKFWPTQLLSWLPVALQQLPSTTTPDQVKATFLADITQ